MIPSGPPLRALGAAVLLLLPGLTAVLSSCSPRPGSPEEQVRALSREAEEAVESKDISRIRALISEHYSDGHGNDRQALTGIVRYHFLRNEAVHLITRISGVSFPERDKSEITVFAAMAGEPIASVDSIDPLRADLYRFDLTLTREDGEWRLTGAQWRRAGVADFF